MPWGNYSMCPSLSADREVIAWKHIQVMRIYQTIRYT
jgi:hypothetical protein